MHRSPTGEVRALEIKTGENPTFTSEQAIVYPHVVGGAGVFSSDYKIGLLILTPGTPLPPIPVDLGWVRRPGERIIYDTIRPEAKMWKFWASFSDRR